MHHQRILPGRNDSLMAPPHQLVLVGPHGLLERLSSSGREVAFEGAAEGAGVVDCVVETLAAICTVGGGLVRSKVGSGMKTMLIHQTKRKKKKKREKKNPRGLVEEEEGTKARTRERKEDMEMNLSESVNELTISHRMSRIPRQSHPPPSPVPLHRRPLRQPLAPQHRIPRQRQESRTERLREQLRVLVPDASDLRRGAQALVAAFATDRQRRRPGPRFRPLVVGYDVDFCSFLFS